MLGRSKMSGEDYLKLFKSAASQWLCDPYSIEIRFIVKKSLNANNLLSCVVNFWPIGVLPNERLRIETQAILAGIEIINDCNHKKLITFIQNLELGQVILEDLSFAIEATKGLSYYSEMISLDRWFCDAHLNVNGDDISTFSSTEIAKIDNELRLGTLPFDGISDLLSYLNLPNVLKGRTSSRIEIRISPPVDIRLDESRLSKGRFKVILHAHPQLNIDNIALAIQTYPESKFYRIQLASKIKWKPIKGGIQRGSLNIRMTKAFAVKAILMAGQNTIRRQFFDDITKVPNRRLACIASFDNDLKMLKRGLNGELDSNGFEIAVNSLAYLLGFSGSVMNETDAPDIVLSSPSESIVLVECTTRIKDFATKLGKLVDRRNGLINMLKAAGDSRKVHGYLVCSLPKNQIAQEDKDLAKHKIVLLAKESLDELVNGLKFPINLDNLLSENEKRLDSMLEQDPLQSKLFQ
jgi:hypothetical protein